MACALQLAAPMDERIHDGPGLLCARELLALLIGGSEAQVLAARLLRGGLAELRRLHFPELAATPGLRVSQALRVAAALELGRRAVLARPLPRVRLLRPEDCARLLWPRLAHLPHEEFWAVLLNARLEELATVRLATGGLTQCSVLPREAFAPAILRGAAAVVFAHNHPSGDPTPSAEDHRLSARLDEIGRALGITVADHLVLAEEGVHSAQAGRSEPPSFEEQPFVRAADTG